jgi:hypothetical protein
MLKTKLLHLSTITLTVSILLVGCGSVKESNPPTETVAPTMTKPASTETPLQTNPQFPPTITPAPTGGNVLQSVAARGIRVDLIGVTYSEQGANIKYCITLPDATNWFPSGIVITANGQTTSELGFSLAGSKHDPGTFAAYRCYISASENAIAQGESFSFSIGIIGKDGTLDGDCPRAQQALASQYPDLKFTCGAVTEGVGGGGGSFYDLVQRPEGWSDQKVDQVIMDAMQQNIYGPWTFTITR